MGNAQGFMKKKKKYISVATRMLLVQQIAILFDYEPDRIHNIACIQDSAHGAWRRKSTFSKHRVGITVFFVPQP